MRASTKFPNLIAVSFQKTAVLFRASARRASLDLSELPLRRRSGYPSSSSGLCSRRAVQIECRGSSGSSSCSVARPDHLRCSLVAWKRIRDTSVCPKNCRPCINAQFAKLPDCREGAKDVLAPARDMWMQSCRSAESDIACVPCLQKAFVEARSRFHMPFAFSDISHRVVVGVI